MLLLGTSVCGSSQQNWQECILSIIGYDVSGSYNLTFETLKIYLNGNIFMVSGN